MADDNAVAGRWRDEDISQALNMHINTVASIRKKFVLEGVKPALQRKYRETPQEDYHYERNGVESIFMFVDPIAGWRRVSNRPQRTLV